MWILSGSFDVNKLRPLFEDVLEACREVGLPSEEKLAMFLRIDKGQLHRQLSGDGHFSLSRLAERMDPLFWATFGWFLVVRFGLPPRAQKAARLRLALLGHKKRTAKADLRPVADRRIA